MDSPSSVHGSIMTGGGGETTRLREEVRYLRRRLQYLQSVSTVFRQRISLLLREVAEDPSRVRELHAAYTALLSETALAEKQDSHDPWGNTTGGGGGLGSRSGSGVGGYLNSPNSQQGSGFGSPNNNNANNGGGYRSHSGNDPVKAREDVRRAHHLCMILQERNELKKRELELEQVNRELMSRLEDMEKNHNAPKGTYTSAANAMQQQTRQSLNQNSITSFMDNNNNQKSNNNNNNNRNNQQQQQNEDASFYYDEEEGVLTKQHKRSNSQDTSSSSVIPGQNMLRSIGGGDHSLPPQAAIVAVQRQNAFLKSRVQRLKQELDESLKQRQGAVSELQSSLDNLARQAQILKTDNARHQREVAEANRGKLDAQKELLFQKSREELLMAKLDSYYHNNNNNNNNHHHNNSDYHNNTSGGGGGQMVQVLSQQLQDRDKMLGETENRINELEDQLRESEAKRASKDVEIAALGAQLKGLRARLDTFDAERSASQVQQSLVADVHDRLLSAVVDIQKGTNSDSLAKCITDVSSKLDRLEGLEQQLRQKEDMLALADDEVARSHAMQQQLKEALAAFSPLFLQLPKSADALERLVIERDELLAEIRKASTEHRAPDLNSVEGKVELRVLQTNSSRGGGNQNIADAFVGSNNNNNGKNVVPPLPPLLDIRAEAHGGNNNNSHDNENNSRNNNNTRDRPRVDAIPLTHLTPNDISATFRLFAPQRVGSDFKLGGEQLALCFAALGVPMPTSASTLRGYGVGVNENEDNGKRKINLDSDDDNDDDQKKIALTEAELIAYIVQKQNQ